MGCDWRSRLIAPARQNPAKTINKIRCIVSPVRKPKAGRNNVQNRQRHQPAPAEVHELVIAEARQRPAHPHIQKEESKNLEHKPEEGKSGIEKDILKGRNQVAEGAGRSEE